MSTALLPAAALWGAVSQRERGLSQAPASDSSVSLFLPPFFLPPHPLSFPSNFFSYISRWIFNVRVLKSASHMHIV